MLRGSKTPKPFVAGEPVLLRLPAAPWFDAGTFLGPTALPSGKPGCRVAGSGNAVVVVPEFFVHREGPEAWAWKSAVLVMREHDKSGASPETLRSDEAMLRKTSRALFRLHPSPDVRRTLP